MTQEEQTILGGYSQNYIEERQACRQECTSTYREVPTHTASNHTGDLNGNMDTVPRTIVPWLPQIGPPLGIQPRLHSTYAVGLRHLGVCILILVVAAVKTYMEPGWPEGQSPVGL